MNDERSLLGGKPEFNNLKKYLESGKMTNHLELNIQKIAQKISGETTEEIVRNIVIYMNKNILMNRLNEDIKKASLAELDGREIETNGSMLVWLPRCTTNGSSVVYSKLLQDYTKDGYSLPTSFTKDSHEVTGIWVSKYDSEYVK